MKQPIGTKTYKGRRVSLPGSESLIGKKDEKILVDAEEFHEKGKTAEKVAKDKAKTDAEKKTQKPEQKKSDSPEPQGDKK